MVRAVTMVFDDSEESVASENKLEDIVLLPAVFLDLLEVHRIVVCNSMYSILFTRLLLRDALDIRPVNEGAK